MATSVYTCPLIDDSYGDRSSTYDITILLEGPWDSILDVLSSGERTTLPMLVPLLAGAAYAHAVKAISQMVQHLKHIYAQDGISVRVESDMLRESGHTLFGVLLGLSDPSELHQTLDRFREIQRASRIEDVGHMPHHLFWPERDALCLVRADGTARVGVPGGFVEQVRLHPERFAVLALSVAVLDERAKAKAVTIDHETILGRINAVVGQFARGYPIPVSILADCVCVPGQMGKRMVREILVSKHGAGLIFNPELDVVIVQETCAAPAQMIAPADADALQHQLDLQRLIAAVLTETAQQAYAHRDDQMIAWLLPHLRLLASTAIHHPDPLSLELITILVDPLADEAPYEVLHYIQNLLATLDDEELATKSDAPEFLEAMLALAHACARAIEHCDPAVGERLRQFEAMIYDHVRVIIDHLVAVEVGETHPEVTAWLIHLSEFHPMPLDLRGHMADRAVSLYEQQVIIHPYDPAILVSLAMADTVRGNTCLVSGDLQRAAEIYRQVADRLIESGVGTSVDDLVSTPIRSEPLAGQHALCHLARGWWLRGWGLLTEAEGDLPTAVHMLKQAFAGASMLVERLSPSDSFKERAIELQRECVFQLGRLMFDVRAATAGELLTQARLMGPPCKAIADDRQFQITLMLLRLTPQDDE